MTAAVLRDNREGLAVLTLNRPEKFNALSRKVFEELLVHIESIEQQPNTVGCVVLRGAGRCFSAGHDLTEIEAGEPLPDFQARVVERLANLPQPVISAVHGYCYTGALELALAADLIVAAASAKFADTHAKWALTPLWGMSQRLPRRIGQSKAREMMLTCRTYTGAEAAGMGLANFCVPDENFDKTVEELSATILSNSWFSHRANKRLLIETDGLPLRAGLAHEVYRNEGVGPDMQERLAAFSGKPGARGR